MKNFIIKVNDNFVLPDGISEISPDEWEIILVSISNILKTKNKVDENNLNVEYENKIKLKDAENEKLILEMKNIKNDYEDCLNFEKDKIRYNLNNEYENKIKLYEDKINLKENTLNEYKTIIDNYKQSNNKNDIVDLFNNLNDNLKPIYKFYAGTNMEKGNLGEKYVYNLLSNNGYFKDGIIEDTSGQTSRGDIYFKWKKLKCLIEIKNKDYVTKEDINKFKKDVLLSSKSLNEVNSAILISLRTNNFYGQTRENIKLEIVNNIPHLYIYLKNNDDIEYAISYLEFINNNKIDHTEKNMILLNYFKQYYNLVTTSIKNYETRITLLEKEIKKLYKEYALYKESLKNIEPNIFLINNEKKVNQPSQLNQPNQPNQTNQTSQTSQTNQNSQTNQLNQPNQTSQTSQTNQIKEYNHVTEEENNIEYEIKEQKNEKIVFDQEHYDRLRIKKTYINSILKNEEIDNKLIEEAKIFGSFDQMTIEAKTEYIDNNITSDVIKQMIEYKNEKGGYPDRKNVIKLKIIKDHIIRKIGKIFNITNAYGHIINYINTHSNLIEQNQTIEE